MIHFASWKRKIKRLAKSKQHQKRAAIALGILAFLLLGYWGVCVALIDAGKINDELLAAIHDTTGLKVSSRGASGSAFPPGVVIDGITIENAEGVEASNSYLLEVPKAKLRFGLGALFRGKALIDHLILVKPDLELERLADGSGFNWDPVMKTGLAHPRLPVERVSIEQGAIAYTNGEKVDTFKAISGRFDFPAGGGFSLKTRLSAFDQPARLELSTSEGKFLAFNHFAYKLKGSFFFGDESLGYAGVVESDPKTGRRYVGTLTAKLDDAGKWLTRVLDTDEKDGFFAVMANKVGLDTEVGLVIGTGKGRVDIARLVIGKSKGEGAFAWDTTLKTPSLQGKAHFSELNLDEITPGRQTTKEQVNLVISSFLPKNLDGEFRVDGDHIIYRGMSLQNLRAESNLTQGDMVINQASAVFPGKTRVITAGILKVDTEKLINYDGTLEMLGDDVVVFITGLGIEQAKLIPQGEQKFRAKANLFLAPGKGTLSEMRFQAGAFEIDGGASLNPSTNFDADYTLRFQHANLDRMVGFLEPLTRKSKPDVFEPIERNLPWLGQMERNYHLNLLFEDFSFGKHKGERTQLVVGVKKNHIDIESIQGMIDGIAIDGMASWDQTEEVPTAQMNMHLSSLDLTSILAPDLVTHPIPRGNTQNVWSGAKFDFDYLRGYNGVMDIQVDKGIHPDFQIDDLKFAATSKNGDWTISGLSGNLWGGVMNASMRMQALTVPAINTEFYLTNVDAEQMFGSLGGFTALKGNSSISGGFATSGVTPLDWIKNVQGKMAFRGDDFVIRGFDLANLVQTIPSVRLVADVVNTARLATLQGQSTFSLVEGAFFFDHGRLASNNITFRSRQSIGKFTGGLDLIHWMMDGTIDFQLITVATEDYPIIRITFNDSMDNPAIGLDTRSLEAFVARRKLQ